MLVLGHNNLILKRKWNVYLTNIVQTCMMSFQIKYMTIIFIKGYYIKFYDIYYLPVNSHLRSFTVQLETNTRGLNLRSLKIKVNVTKTSLRIMPWLIPWSWGIGVMTLWIHSWIVFRSYPVFIKIILHFFNYIIC